MTSSSRWRALKGQDKTSQSISQHLLPHICCFIEPNNKYEQKQKTWLNNLYVTSSIFKCFPLNQLINLYFYILVKCEALCSSQLCRNKFPMRISLYLSPFYRFLLIPRPADTFPLHDAVPTMFNYGEDKTLSKGYKELHKGWEKVGTLGQYPNT